MKVTREVLKNIIKEVMQNAGAEHAMAKKVFEEESKSSSGEFTEVAFNSMMASSVFMDDLNEEMHEAVSHELEFSLPSDPNPEVIDRFYNSLYSGARSGFLTYYSKNDLAAMHLYLIKGHNAGFALKGGNDIVSVHNNSELRGLGQFFLDAAKEKGGTMLDHFDGFLSGLYRKNGFGDVYEIYQWDEQYRPQSWSYDPTDIFNPNRSVYSDAMNQLLGDSNNPQATLPNEEVEIVAESGLKMKINPNLKYNQYLYGRPDVIMRRLGGGGK